MNSNNLSNQQWQEQATDWEYSAAATPDLPYLPVEVFPASYHIESNTGVIALDISNKLKTDYPATTPSLLANFIKIIKNDSMQTSANSSSEVFYCMYGNGYTETEFGKISWKKGDAFTLPSNKGAKHFALENSALSWVHDEPLLKYLGVSDTTPRFKPAFYEHDKMMNTIAAMREENIKHNKNRNGIILGNTDTTATKTITHSMWSLNNLIPPNTVQKPHRHQSVAIDLATNPSKDVYTLIGKNIDEKGNIVEPIKANWSENSIFITPPGWWHSHHNESNEDAYVFPFQDAGLHTYLRTLDIQFVN